MEESGVTMESEVSVLTALRSLNFYGARDHLAELGEQALHLARNAGGTGGIEAIPSLPFSSQPVAATENLLVIDVGGSFTKGGVRLIRDGATSWTPLFACRNQSLEPESYEGSSFHTFAHQLASLAAREARAKGVAITTLRHAAVVWSNAIALTHSPSEGLVGSVTQREGYRKREWFIRDLRNGDSISEPLMSAFRSAGFPISFSIIGNDTPFTLTASPGSHAGMVASTGVNATIIKPASLLTNRASPVDVVCNTEVGGRFLLTDSIRSSADTILSPLGEDTMVEADTIECVISGMFLPQILASHVVALAHHGVVEFSKVGKTLDAMGMERFQVFDAPLLSLLIKHEFSRAAQALSPHLHCNEAEFRALGQLATEIVKRAGALAGVVAWLSVSERSHEYGVSKVALDSTLGREIPLFLSELTRTANQCAGGYGTISIELLKGISTQEGTISVPMLGAAHAIDQMIRL